MTQLKRKKNEAASRQELMQQEMTASQLLKCDICDSQAAFFLLLKTGSTQYCITHSPYKDEDRSLYIEPEIE